MIGLLFWDYGKPLVAPLFRKVTNGWVRVQKTPPRQSWTMCIDGRPAGAVASRPQGKNSIGPEHGHVPLGKAAPAAAGRSLWAGDEEGPRPIVLSATGRCDEPENWSASPLPDATRHAVLAALRDSTKNSQCVDKDEVGDYRYPDSAVSLDQTYASPSGDRIVVARVDDPDCPEWCEDSCDLRTAFGIRPDGSIVDLGGSEVVGAGDYDGDGQTEIIVRYAGEWATGVLLVWNHFQNKVNCLLSYEE